MGYPPSPQCLAAAQCSARQPVAIGARLQHACAAIVILLMRVGAWHANLAAVSASFRQATASFGNRLRQLGLQHRWMVFSSMPMVNDAC